MIKAIIIDDEKRARLNLTLLLTEYCSDITIIAECENLPEGVKAIRKNKPDLVFLDIEMPHITGFDLLDGLKVKPQIVFITSKADYAVKAFDYAAVDFLQKPIKKERFLISVKKAVEMYHLKRDVATEDQGPHIIIKSNLKKIKV